MVYGIERENVENFSHLDSNMTRQFRMHQRSQKKNSNCYTKPDSNREDMEEQGTKTRFWKHIFLAVSSMGAKHEIENRILISERKCDGPPNYGLFTNGNLTSLTTFRAMH